MLSMHGVYFAKMISVSNIKYVVEFEKLKYFGAVIP